MLSELTVVFTSSGAFRSQPAPKSSPTPGVARKKGALWTVGQETSPRSPTTPGTVGILGHRHSAASATPGGPRAPHFSGRGPLAAGDCLRHLRGFLSCPPPVPFPPDGVVTQSTRGYVGFHVPSPRAAGAPAAGLRAVSAPCDCGGPRRCARRGAWGAHGHQGRRGRSFARGLPAPS